MRGKTCLITGANAGIGREATAGLAAQGARILMVCRDIDRGEAARSNILARVPGAELELIQADLSTIGAVRNLVRDVSRHTDRLDVLVSNAGQFNTRRTITADGLETTFAVNYLAPFILVNGLLDLLRRSQPARVVVVASGAHYRGTIRFDDLQANHGYGGWKAYTQSKLANVLFAAELARRVGAGEVTVNSLHPGSVATKLLLRGIVPPWLARPWTITPEQGAKTSIHLASSETVSRVSGRYFENCREKEPSVEARDLGVAERLWTASDEIIEQKVHNT
ncbi:MAG: SDR family oxidoreductase [Gemmatimonadales bacterium]|nr:MAG: SDR family oxidoreductase [Gemmatimonadales bacterium]